MAVWRVLLNISLADLPLNGVTGIDASGFERAHASSHYTKRAMVDGTRLWEFGVGDLGLLVAVAVGYLLGGYVVFHYATRRARRLGVLGDY